MKTISKRQNNQPPLKSRKADQIIKNLVVQVSRVETADISNWKTAVNQYKQGNRIALYSLLENLMSDPVLADSVDKLTGAVTNAELMFQKDGKSVEEIDDLIDTPEFERMLEEIVLSFAWGKSVFEVSFAPEFNVFPFPRKNIRITNLDKPLSQRKKFISEKISDRDGYDYTKDEFIIECGYDEDMGFLFRAAQYVIYKRGGFGDWAQFVEIFGMPFITGEYEGYDENARDLLYKALSEIGGNTRIAAPKGSDIKVTPSGSGSSNLYQVFRRACNEEILIAVVGNTMTTLEGSSRAQSQTHKETQEERFKRIRRYTQRILNRYILPLLIKRGYDVAGGFFSFPDSGESISTKERVNMALEMRKEGLPVDDNYIFEISGVAKAKDGKQKTEPDPPKKKEPEKNTVIPEDKVNDDRNFLLKLIDKVFPFAPTMRSGANRSWRRIWRMPIKAQVKFDDGYTIDTGRLIQEAIDEVYGNKGSDKAVNPQLFRITNDSLQHAICRELEDNVEDKDFIRQFRENAAVFAAFKNHQQTELFVKALYDENGKLRSYSKFRKECLKIGEKFNEQYLQTEYNTAVRAARMAANLKKYEKTAYLYPNLEYMETLSSHPREQHLEYVGTILPIHHEAWSWLMPPSDWNCDCRVRPTDKEVTAVPVKPADFNTIFDNNPADSAKFVNTEETPYYKHTQENIRHRIEEEAREMLRGYHPEKDITEVYEGKNGGYLEIVKQPGQERDKNKVTYKIMADNGGKYTLLKPSNEKSPDAFNYTTGQTSDAKHPQTDKGKNAIQASIREASRQKVSEVIIRLDKEYSVRSLYEGMKAAFQHGRGASVKRVIIIPKGKKPVYFKTDDIRKFFREKK